MHSKSDCRLLWRVAADMFIVVMAVGADGGAGRSPTLEFLKLPVYMEVKQMGTLGCEIPRQPPQQIPVHTQVNIQTHKSVPSHPKSIRQLFFLQLSQSHSTASFTATICPQSAHAHCETFSEGKLRQHTLLSLQEKKGVAFNFKSDKTLMKVVNYLRIHPEILSLE